MPPAAPDSGLVRLFDFAFCGPIIRAWLTTLGSNYAPGFNGDQICRTKTLAAVAERIYNEHRELVMEHGSM